MVSKGGIIGKNTKYLIALNVIIAKFNFGRDVIVFDAALVWLKYAKGIYLLNLVGKNPNNIFLIIFGIDLDEQILHY